MKTLLLLLCALALAGRASPGRDIDASLRAQYMQGTPTKVHILKIMGKPDRVTVKGAVQVWEYSFAYDPKTRMCYPPKTIGKNGRGKADWTLEFNGKELATLSSNNPI